MADKDPKKYLRSEKAYDLMKWKHNTTECDEVEQNYNWQIYQLEYRKRKDNKENTAPTSLPDPSPVQCGGPSVPGPAQPLPGPAQPLPRPAQPLPGPSVTDPSLTAQSHIPGPSSKGPRRKRKIHENNVEANKMQLRSNNINQTKRPSKTQETNVIKKTSSTTIGNTPSNIGSLPQKVGFSLKLVKEIVAMFHYLTVDIKKPFLRPELVKTTAQERIAA